MNQVASETAKYMKNQTEQGQATGVEKFLPLSCESGIIFTSLRNEAGDRYGINGSYSGELVPTAPLCDYYWSDAPESAKEVRELYALIVRAVNLLGAHEAVAGLAEEIESYVCGNNTEAALDMIRNELPQALAALAKGKEGK